jgi:hypothetical protein
VKRFGSPPLQARCRAEPLDPCQEVVSVALRVAFEAFRELVSARS